MSGKIQDARGTAPGAAGTAAIPFNEQTVSDFAASLTLSPHSVASYKKCLSYFFTYIAERGIARPDSSHVFAYCEELKASGRKANTVYGYMAAVKAFFRWTGRPGCRLWQDG